MFLYSCHSAHSVGIIIAAVLLLLLLCVFCTLQALPDEQRRDRAAAMALRIASMMGSSVDFGSDSSDSDNA
jgi:hypothetical protein